MAITQNVILLKLGMEGEAVELWQYFLIGQQFPVTSATGKFDNQTLQATKLFQADNNLGADGVVGKKCYETAIAKGFVLTDDFVVKSTATTTSSTTGTTTNNSQQKTNNLVQTDEFPPLPTFRCMPPEEIVKTFGEIVLLDAAGTPTRSEKWYNDNITTLNIPQLNKIVNPNGKLQTWGHNKGDILFNKKVAKQMTGLWEAWEKAGLLKFVIEWSNSYSFRFIRGSSVNYSTHAFGISFDINVQWNKLGMPPAATGAQGCLRELVPLANQFGFFWGGHYRNRKDGMHFEIAKVL